ncbi:site-specific integrase [Micromonospora sp.]|uniref:site-specific integrase n=1 Tax=Micromonospora sp. TaxID=1876 RepID=UPI003B3AC568
MRAAVPAFSGRYRGQSRVHTESDLRVFLRWCSDHGLDPLSAARMDIERYVRWLQDVLRYQPSTASRRLSVVVGFYPPPPGCRPTRTTSPWSPSLPIQTELLPSGVRSATRHRVDGRRGTGPRDPSATW